MVCQTAESNPLASMSKGFVTIQEFPVRKRDRLILSRYASVKLSTIMEDEMNENRVFTFTIHLRQVRIPALQMRL
jgi:hypothetical protein